MRRVGLGDARCRHHLVAGFVERLEVAAVERDMGRVLAREHGVRLGTGGDEDGARHCFYAVFFAAREA